MTPLREAELMDRLTSFVAWSAVIVVTGVTWGAAIWWGVVR